MSGFFGVISKTDSVSPVFYGTDYHSHLGTKRAGLAYFNPKDGFQRAIHSLEDGYFRTKFENDLEHFSGNSGIGSCSILILTENMMIAARDNLGRTPVVIGKNGDGFAVASETCAFPNLNYEVEKFLGPGEIVRITLQFQTLHDLVEAIGLPKEKLCTHCWDGSSYFKNSK